MVTAGIQLLEDDRLTADELLSRLDSEPTLIGEHLYDVAKALADSGQTARATEIGWRVLADPTSDQTDFALGVDLMFALGAEPGMLFTPTPTAKPTTCAARSWSVQTAPAA